MRILLIPDTHGNLRQINDLARATNADVVLHAGDFGFSDDASADRLRDRELSLRLIHSEFGPELRAAGKRLSRTEMVSFIREKCPLSELPRFLRGEDRFDVPVYAVWGNYEDVEVINAFRSGKYSVENLHVVDERRIRCNAADGLFGATR